jgi:hypothetical protein
MKFLIFLTLIIFSLNRYLHRRTRGAKCIVFSGVLIIEKTEGRATVYEQGGLIYITSDILDRGHNNAGYVEFILNYEDKLQKFTNYDEKIETILLDKVKDEITEFIPKEVFHNNFKYIKFPREWASLEDVLVKFAKAYDHLGNEVAGFTYAIVSLPSFIAKENEYLKNLDVNEVSYYSPEDTSVLFTNVAGLIKNRRNRGFQTKLWK